MIAVAVTAFVIGLVSGFCLKRGPVCLVNRGWMTGQQTSLPAGSYKITRVQHVGGEE